MSRRLFIWPGSLSASPVRWLLLDRRQVESGELALDELATLSMLSQRSHTVVVIPGQQVCYRRIALRRRSRLLMKTLPYQLEDSLSVPIEDCHLVTDSGMGHTVGVAALSHTAMQSWRALIQASQLSVDCLCPDFLLLPDENTIYVDQQRVLMRDGQTGWSLSQRSYDVWLTLSEQNGSGDYAASALTADALLKAMAESYRPGRVLNFLQGEYRRDGTMHQRSRRVRWMVWLLIGLGVTYTLMLFSDNQRLQQQINHLDSAVAQEYQAAFPESRHLIRPRLQMQRKLDQLEQSVSNHSLLGELGRINAVVVNAGFSARALSYRHTPLALSLELEGKTSTQLVALKSELRRLQVEAEIDVLQKGPGYLSVRLHVKGER